MLYLVSYNLLPEKFDPSYVVVGCVAFCVLVRLGYSYTLGPDTDEEIEEKVAALYSVLNDPPEGAAIPGHIRVELDATYQLWTTRLLSDKECSKNVANLQTQVRQVLLPNVRSRRDFSTPHTSQRLESGAEPPEEV
jgi:hypothetical protein